MCFDNGSKRLIMCCMLLHLHFIEFSGGQLLHCLSLVSSHEDQFEELK